MANEQTPYLEDNARKATTHGEAIFGDKQADLLNGSAPEAQASTQDSDELKENASHAAAILAINQAAKAVAIEEFAVHGDNITEDRLAAIRRQSTPVAK